MTEQKPSPRGVRSVVGLLEHGQDYLSAAVGVVLLIMAVAVLGGAVADFFRSLLHADVEAAVNALLDRVLLTLILVEIVHTVVLSLRAHHLVAQPLIVVGLVATIRKVLFVLSGPSSVSTATLALLLAMVVVFVAAFFLVSRLDTGDSLPGEVVPPPHGGRCPAGRADRSPNADSGRWWFRCSCGSGAGFLVRRALHVLSPLFGSEGPSCRGAQKRHDVREVAHVRQLDEAIAVARGQRIPVRAECHRVDEVGRAAEGRADLLAGGYIPQPRRVVA
jgi:uncharacterized membrane protein (DUF373 family)